MKAKKRVWPVIVLTIVVALAAVWFGTLRFNAQTPGRSSNTEDVQLDDVGVAACVQTLRALGAAEPLQPEARTVHVKETPVVGTTVSAWLEDANEMRYFCIYVSDDGVQLISSDKVAAYGMGELKPSGNRFDSSDAAYIYAMNLLEPMLGGEPYVVRKFEYRPHVIKPDGTFVPGVVDLSLSRTHQGYTVISAGYGCQLDPADGSLLNYSGGDTGSLSFKPLPNRILTQDEAIAKVLAEFGRQTTSANIADLKDSHDIRLLWGHADTDRTTNVMTLTWAFVSNAGSIGIDAGTGAVISRAAKKG